MIACLKGWCQTLVYPYANVQITVLLSSCKQTKGFIGLQQLNGKCLVHRLENFFLFFLSLLEKWK